MNARNDRAEQAQKIEKEQQVTEFNNLLAVLAEARFEFEVHRCDTIQLMDENDQLNPIAMIPGVHSHLGEDIRLVIFPWDNTDVVIYEFDPNSAIDARKDVEERLEELK
jgi:hypothetical protein